MGSDMQAMRGSANMGMAQGMQADTTAASSGGSQSPGSHHQMMEDRLDMMQMMMEQMMGQMQMQMGMHGSAK
jgi:hypothetical protein